MFKSLFGIVEDVVKVVAAPVEIAVDVARVATKPVGDLAQAAAKEVKEVTKDITED
ncbi:MAG: hypothetical protein AB9Q19_01420 [Candidatus Reddybacter sp.]